MLLIGATTIPLTLLSAGILYSEYRSNRATAEKQLVRQAQTLARLVDREIERAQAIARASSASTALARGDLDAFRRELVEITRAYAEDLPAGAQRTVMSFAGLDGRWIVDSKPEIDLAAGNDPASDYVLRTIGSGRAQVSDLYTGAFTGQPRISVAVPVYSPLGVNESKRHLTGAIGVAISRQRFIQIVEQTRLAPGTIASIQDCQGFIVARSLNDAKAVGKRPPPAILEAILGGGDAGLAPRGTRTLDGVPSTVAFAHAENSGFTIVLNMPEAAFLAQLRGSLERAGMVGLLTLAVGLGLSVLLARRLIVALRQMVPAAQAAARARAAPQPLGLREADDVAGELTRVLIGQRAAAAALMANEAKLRTIADALPQLVWAADPIGRCDYFNARCYTFSGHSDLDAESWRRLVHPDDRVALALCWRRGLSTSEPFEFECRARRHDGEYRWMLVRAIPVRHEGTLIRWFGSWTDITDLVEARDVAARGRAELEILIEQRTRDLVDMQARLAHAARMEALGQLAGGIAHDFNNVLQAVLGGSALIERRPDDTEMVVKHARMVFDSAERGAAITGRLLEFSRRNDLQAESIDTLGLLHDIQSILSHTLGAAVRTEIDAPPELPPLLADKAQLETVLVNLAANARDAMGGRGVIVLAAALESVADDERDHPAKLRPGPYLRLSVTDTGIGMDAATLRRVIEPFFTTKSAGKGTGLGLAMAHGFAAQSGGSLLIESAPGQGTTVRLWLPAAGSSAQPAPVQTLSATSAESALLLLVDDEPLVRDVVKETLELEGYQVLDAPSGEAAMAIVQREPIDLLISDLSMPGMDGATLIRMAQRHRPGLPALLVTGFARDEAGLAASNSGAFALLRKPVTSAQLCARIAELLHAARPAPRPPPRPALDPHPNPG